MLVQTTRARNANLAQADLAAEPKVAVLLNANAKRVTDKVINRVRHVVPEEDLFVSRTLDDCRLIAQKVVERRYHTVFTGGGDGTFTAFTNSITEELRKQGLARFPRFGVLKLGTGNSLANLVGASPLHGDGILDDILRARAGEVPSVRRVDLLTVDGKLAPFAGMGYDAAILNDYVDVTRAAGSAKPLVAGLTGYAVAITTKTIPYYLVHRKLVQGEIVCEGRAIKMGEDGKPAQIFAKGDVLYRGPLCMVSAGTVPCYGFNLKMFPHAGKRRGMMHLRAASVSPSACLANLPGMWKGTWRHPEIHDFLTDGASVRLERAMPFQVSGDAAGWRDRVSFSMAERSVDLVDFTATLN